MSNPKRGQAVTNCKHNINDIRGLWSNKSRANCQICKKDSTFVDTNPGFNCQENKFKCGDGAGDVVGIMKVGDVVGEKSCTFCGNLFTDNEDMKRHIEIKHYVHGGGEKTKENIKIICELCEKVFPNRV